MKRLLIALAAMATSAAATVGMVHAAGCAGNLLWDSLTIPYDVTLTPPQCWPTGIFKNQCGITGPANCTCNWTHDVFGEYWHSDPNGGYYVLMWSEAESPLISHPCLQDGTSYQDKCVHGGFNVLYKGAWRITHWWHVQSCNVGRRSWMLQQVGTMTW